MPLDKDTQLIFENWKATFPNKVNHNKPSTLADVKSSTAATAGSELDVKGQGSDKGEAHNTPVDVRDEDAEESGSNLVKTRVEVDLYLFPFDMEDIEAECDKRGLTVLYNVNNYAIGSLESETGSYYFNFYIVGPEDKVTEYTDELSNEKGADVHYPKPYTR